jgi:hypothetical protein
MKIVKTQKKKDTVFSSAFSICLSRACLGRMIISIYKWLKKTVFLKTGEHWAQHGFWEFDVYQNGGRKPSLLYTTFNQH